MGGCRVVKDITYLLHAHELDIAQREQQRLADRERSNGGCHTLHVVGLGQFCLARFIGGAFNRTCTTS
jgi:hypothetical protein